MSGSPTHWMYPVNQTGEYILDRLEGSAVRVNPDAIWHDVQTRHPGSTSWLLSKGFRIMEAGDLIWIYATAPFQCVCAVARAVDIYWDQQDGRYYVEMMWDLELSRALRAAPVTRDQLGGQHIQSVQRANQSSIRALDDWLRQRRVGPHTLTDPDGPASQGEARAWTLRQVRQRQGQGPFRERLLQHYDGKCAVTGESCLDVLEAAHIRPFAESEDHEATNGLLLRSDLHTLFDLHLIGVDADGTLVVSSKVTSSTYRSLHGTRLFMPQSVRAHPCSSTLAEHLGALDP